ncbi:hypothetical protein LJC20_04835, partial [Eubacteriales bacterium OttesenSCG-928-M02]|nr:hypothetical protein [Eubacteriales bacterium OttesenSCG-928-M02]
MNFISRNKRITALVLSLFLLVSLVVGCNSSPGADTAAIEAFDAFLNERFIESISNSIVDVHYTLKNPEALGIADVPITWGEYTLAAMEEEEAKIAKNLADLKAFDRT